MARALSMCASVLLALTLVAGCASGDKEVLPPTSAVTGRVLDRDGKPLAGGAIELRSAEHPALTIMGQIKEDGTFSLFTLGNRTNAEGAPAGKYRATVMFAVTGSVRGVEPVELAAEYEIKDGANDELVIKLADGK